MRLVIAGATGQVAQALLERASEYAGERGDAIEAIAVGRPTLDLAEPETIAAFAQDLKIGDVVVNAAAYTGVDSAESNAEAARAINADGAGMLAAAVAAKNCPFIHLSTDYVFSGDKQTPYKEDDAAAPLGVYGRTKHAGERLVADAHDGAVILRTSWVYSPFGMNFLKTMLRLAAEREAVNVVADQWGAPTSALDIADGVIAVAKQCVEPPAGRSGAVAGVFHMAGAGEASWADFAEAAFAASAAAGGPTARVNRIKTADYPTPAARPKNSRLNCDKLASVYGVRLQDWRQSVAATTERLIREGR